MVALGGGAVSYERGTPVALCRIFPEDERPAPSGVRIPTNFFMTLKTRVE